MTTDPKDQESPLSADRRARDRLAVLEAEQQAVFEERLSRLRSSTKRGGRFVDDPAGPANRFGHDGRPLWRYRYANGTEVLVYRASDGQLYFYRTPPIAGSHSGVLVLALMGGLLGALAGPVAAGVGAALGAGVGLLRSIDD